MMNEQPPSGGYIYRQSGPNMAPFDLGKNRSGADHGSR